MDLIVESLDTELEDFDINNIGSNTINEDDLDNECIIYSYPYYNEESFDYEFRVTVTENRFILDEVRCNDEEIDFEKCIEELKTVCDTNIDSAIELINKGIDLRDGQTPLHIENEFVNLNVANLNNDEKSNIIEQNKNVVLKELYQEILVSLS